MPLRLSRWYMAAVIAGGLYLVGWLYVAGYFGAVVQVDFNYAPDLEGAAVFIDGDSAGVLFRRGRQRLSGFRVRLGEHRVWVRRDTLPTDTAAVQAEVRGAQYLVYAWVEGRRGEDGVRRRRVRFGRNPPD